MSHPKTAAPDANNRGFGGPAPSTQLTPELALGYIGALEAEIAMLQRRCLLTEASNRVMQQALNHAQAHIEALTNPDDVGDKRPS